MANHSLAGAFFGPADSRNKKPINAGLTKRLPRLSVDAARPETIDGLRPRPGMTSQSLCGLV
jgi:hypothetical protein